MKLPRISGGLLAVSIGINFLFAATDAESPAGVGSLAMADNREMYLYSPLTEYAAPLFFEGRAWPILNMLIEDRLAEQEDALIAEGVPEAARKPMLAKTRGRSAAIDRGGKRRSAGSGQLCGAGLGEPDGSLRGGILQLV